MFAGEAALSAKEWPVVEELERALGTGQVRRLSHWWSSGAGVADADADVAVDDVLVTPQSLTTQLADDAAGRHMWEALQRELAPSPREQERRELATLAASGASDKEMRAATLAAQPLTSAHAHATLKAIGLRLQVRGNPVTQ